jgi:hypothetical protein
MDPEEFNDILKERYKWENNEESPQFKNEIDEINEMTKTMKGFVKKTSDYEGVETDFDKVQLDPTKFSNAINKILGMKQET